MSRWVLFAACVGWATGLVCRYVASAFEAPGAVRARVLVIVDEDGTARWRCDEEGIRTLSRSSGRQAIVAWQESRREVSFRGEDRFVSIGGQSGSQVVLGKVGLGPLQVSVLSARGAMVRRYGDGEDTDLRGGQTKLSLGAELELTVGEGKPSVRVEPASLALVSMKGDVELRLSAEGSAAAVVVTCGRGRIALRHGDARAEALVGGPDGRLELRNAAGKVAATYPLAGKPR